MVRVTDAGTVRAPVGAVTDLVVWLRQQLDADDRYGKAIKDIPNGQVYDGERWVDILVGGEQVLRTVAGHRAILDLHGNYHRCVDLGGHGVWFPLGKACPTLLFVAAIYESRPGFDPSWRADPCPP